MSSKNPQFVNGEIYHVFNRGVEKRKIFQQISDYFRFVFSLYELNDKNLVLMRDRISKRKYRKKYRGATPANFANVRDKREPLIEIIAFCLMPNHYHLVLRQLVDGGISLFMKKLGDSYVGYFNQKHNRSGMGSLFQGRFKAVHVTTTEQLMYLIIYVFTNPVSILEKDWKEKGVKNPKKVIHYLKKYRWSSYIDSIGGKNFPSVTEKDLLVKIFGSSENIQREVESLILSKNKVDKNFGQIKDLTLD